MVELRSGTSMNSHMHYIRAIKGESIQIVMNMNARRKSNLMFRQLVVVYDCEHENNDESNPRVVKDIENVSDLTQSSCLFGDEVSSEDFNITTLQKIRENCKEKKRKRRNSRDTKTTLNVEVKQEHLNHDKECDLEEPLSAWNSKSSKRIKAKQKPKAKYGCATSPSVKKGDFPLLCGVKPEVSDDSYSGFEVMDFNPTHPSVDFNKESESPTHTELVKEIIMHDSFKDMRLPLYCSAEPYFLGMVTIEDAIATELVEKPFEDASEEFSKARHCSLDKIVLYSNMPREEIELEVPQHIESENIGCVRNHISLNTSSGCEDIKEDVESNDSVTNLGMNITALDIVKVEEIIMHDSFKDTKLTLCCCAEPNFPGMVTIEDAIATEVVENAFEDASQEFSNARNVECSLDDNVALQDNEIVLYGNVHREEIELEVPHHSESENIGCVRNHISLNTSSGCEDVKEDVESTDSVTNIGMNRTGLEIVKVEAPKILGIDYPRFPFMDFGLQNTEFFWEPEDIAKDDLPVATDVLQLTNYDNTQYNMLLVPYDSRVSLEEGQFPERLQQPSYSMHEDEAAYHKSSQLYKASDKVQKPEESDIILHPKTHHQPKKLLSGRKAFSPTSQEKLRKAIEQPDSPEKRSKKSKGKLYFSSHHSHRILKAEGLDNIDIVDVIPNSKKIIQKTKMNTRQTQYQRFTHKFPRRVNRAAKSQPFSTGSTSLQGCSEKAVAFCQGQILDFQYVADKLTKELRSMRQITKRCLQAEGNRFKMTVSNFDEVNNMIKNAEKTEENSKKRLSMIERDCTRFCKLMGMVKEHSPATDNIVQKKRKIRFADDAGGDLCHVKVYEID